MDKPPLNFKAWLASQPPPPRTDPHRWLRQLDQGVRAAASSSFYWSRELQRFCMGLRR
jgi:hypothetical protein